MSSGKVFNSIAGNQIERFLAYHRALGKKYENEEWALRLNDRFIDDQSDIVSIEHITPAVLNQFLLSRPRSSHRGFNHLLGVLQRLFRWLIVQQVLTKSPLEALPRRVTEKRHPYLFQPSEVERLLDITAQLPNGPQWYCRGVTYRMRFLRLCTVLDYALAKPHACADKMSI